MKHVLVIVDKREGTASRKKDATDLMTLWSKLRRDQHISYQLACYPLDIGDVWFCQGDAPFDIPPHAQWVDVNVLDATTEPISLVQPTGNLDDFFQVPASREEEISKTTVDILGDVPPENECAETSKLFPPVPVLVVERKALADLKDSYGDGRYKDQKARLINCDAYRVLLLVEGYNGKRIKDPSLKKSYLSTFVHSMLRDNIHTYHTCHIQDSFEWLHHVAVEMVAGKLERSADYMERTKYTDNIQMARKNNLTPERGLELQLASIPNVSAKMARAVVEKYPSMLELCAAYAAQPTERDRYTLLAELTFRGPSGKEQRLASRSEKIYQYVSGQSAPAPAKEKKRKPSENPKAGQKKLKL